MSELNEQGNPVIYILTNPSFPEYIKIGYANDVDKRLCDLNNTTCTPFAFRIFATYEVPKSEDTKTPADKFFHKIIDTLKPELRTKDILNGKERIREFFAMSPEDAYLLLQNIAQLTNTEDKLHRYTPNEQELQDEEIASKIRKENFSFGKCKINPGAVITLEGHPDITATVVDDRYVEYEGEVSLLSPLTRRLLNKGPVQGARYWNFDGRKLTDIRDEMEEEES